MPIQKLSQNDARNVVVVPGAGVVRPLMKEEEKEEEEEEEEEEAEAEAEAAATNTENNSCFEL